MKQEGESSQEDGSEPQEKRVKQDKDGVEDSKEEEMDGVKRETTIEKKKKEPPARCPDCRQLLDDADLIMYAGDPEHSVSLARKNL